MKYRTKILFALFGVMLIAIVMVMILTNKEDEGELYKENSEQKEELNVADVYTDHYHFKEVHNGNVYLIRRIGPDTDEEWTDENWADELWKYDTNNAGQKLYACQGLDFRVSPNEKYISVTDYNGMYIIDAEGNKIKDYTIEELSNGEYKNESALGIRMQWSDDSLSFWAELDELYLPLRILKINTVNWSKTGYYDVTQLPVSAEFILNPNTGKIVLSDYPVMLDALGATEFEASKEKVTLFYYDLVEEKLTQIESSSAKMFNPQWIDDFTIEFDNPKGQDRLRYKLKD